MPFFSFKNKTKLKYSDLVCRIFEGSFPPTLQKVEDQNTLTEQDITILCYGQNTVKGKQQNSSKTVAGKHSTTDSHDLCICGYNFLIPSRNRISILTNIADSEGAEKNPVEWKYLQKFSTLDSSKLFEFTFKIGLLEDTSLSLSIYRLICHVTTLKFKKTHY